VAFWRSPHEKSLTFNSVRHLRLQATRLTKRTLIVVAILLGATELLYVIGANLFLSLGGIAKLFETTNTINAKFERAWTFWPGHVHVRNLRVVFQDVNVQWSLDMTQAKVVLDLSELLNRTFHAKSVQGEGTVFRFRHRVDPASANEPAIQVLPQIAEFPGTAVFEATVPPTPITDAEYDLWTVHLEGVDVGVTELWVQQFRYLGSGRARGAFRLRPARSLWVGPASLDLEPGALTAGNYEISPGLAGRITCTVHPFDVREPAGREVFRFISTHIQLDASNLSLAASRLFLPNEKTAVRADGGSLRIDVSTDHGKFSSSSQLELTQQGLVVDHPKVRLVLGRSSLAARVTPQGWGEALLGLEQGQVSLPGSAAQPLVLEHLHASALSSSVDTTADWSLVRAQLFEAQISVPDVSWFNGLIDDAGWFSSGGGSKLFARASYEHGELEGDARARFENVRINSPQTKIVVDGEANFTWSKTRTTERSGVISGTLSGKQLRLERGTTVLDASGIRLDARAQAANGAGQGSLEARVAGLRVAEGQTALRAAQLLVRSQVVSHATREIDATLHSTAQGLEANLGRTRLRGSPELHVSVKGFHQQRQHGQVHGDLVVHNLSAGDIALDPDCPWSRIERSTVRADAALQGTLGARLRLGGELSRVRLAWGDFRTVADEVHFETDFDQSVSTTGTGRLLVALGLNKAKLHSGSGAPSGWDTTLPNLHLSADLNKSGASLGGSVALWSEQVRARIGRTTFNADLGARVSLANLQPKQRVAIGGGAVSIRRLGMKVQDDEVKDWWADVNVDFVNISAKENLDLASAFHAKFRDALPALTVLSAHDELPGWVPTLFPLRELQATGTVVRRCRLTDFHVSELQGGPLISAGRVQSVTDRTSGAFLVQLEALNPISAGLTFDEESSDLSLFAGNDWLTNEMRVLDERARRKEKQRCIPVPQQCGD
jgi:hypothetical protein